jgi:serine/threonine protein kinase/predicted ATPase
MASASDPPDPAGTEDWSALEHVIKRFVAAWRQGARPPIGDALPAEGPGRRLLLVELVHTELELRLKAGEPARAEEYLTRYPELADDVEAAVGLVVAEYDLRRRAEPHLPPDEFVQRFPRYRAELLKRLAQATRVGGDTPGRKPEPGPTVPPEAAGYEILGPLGRGGMGVVYKARQLSLNRLVALKFLPEDCARDSWWLGRFRREGRIASALNHPHICTIYDSGEAGGRPFLSMELIEGQTVEALAGRRPGVAEVVCLVRQAARALAAAHAAGVVHRDIKPQNLMVRGDGIVKVLDFGLARRLPAGAPPGAAPPGAGTSPLGGPGGTDPGARLGTLLYMSPEQARSEPMGTATDVFSLGVVLYELTTGQHPFEADTEAAVLANIVDQAPAPPSCLRAEVPAALEGLVLRMLAKDPRLRPAAAEVEAALAELTDSAPGPRRSPGPGRRPTVGRADERAALRAAFEAAADGQGSVLCVTGEPGLGKTTLVEDALEELADGGWLYGIARGRCSERLAGAEAYLPLLEALDSLLRGPEGASAAPVMRLLAPSWYAQLAPGGAPPGPNGASQERLKREFCAFVEEISRLRPLVLFLDDVHWADPSTTDLLAYLGDRCGDRRLLVVLAYRATELALGRHALGPVKLELQARGLCREVAVGLLGPPDVERYLAASFPGHEFPAEFAEVLYRRTEGHPLFLADLLDDLSERGAIAAAGGRWALAQAVPDLQPELPESVRALIRRKVDRLGESHCQLLAAAGVQGAEFDAAVVARVLGREAADVEDGLAELDRAHAFVRFVREHELPDRTPTARYAFAHGLYQNALYASLQPARRVALSAAVARALLDHYGERNPAVATELALLFEAARDFPGAACHFLYAAEHAVGVAAHQEAAVLARRGLDLLRSLPDTPARAGQELTLLLALGVSLVATRGFASPEVEQAYARARALCERDDDVSTLVPVLYGLWNVYLVRCDFPACEALAARVFGLAHDQADPVFLQVAHNVLQQPLFHRGELAAARRHQQEGFALYDPARHRGLTAVYGEDPGVGCLVYGAVTLWHLGYPDQAVRSAEAGRRLAEGLGHPFNVAQALYFGAVTRQCRREPERVEELAEALTELCREEGYALLLAGGAVLHGWSLARRGRAEEGVGKMRQGLADWQATGALSHRPYHLALLAEALAAAGRPGEGLTSLDEAQALCAATGEGFHEAELHRLRGSLLLGQVPRTSEPTEAEGCFRQALDVARRQGAKSLELRAATSLGRLWSDQGRGAEARPLLAECRGWFAEGFDSLDYREAGELLERLGQARGQG